MYGRPHPLCGLYASADRRLPGPTTATTRAAGQCARRRDHADRSDVRARVDCGATTMTMEYESIREEAKASGRRFSEMLALTVPKSGRCWVSR
jgi:hypothetical protein